MYRLRSDGSLKTQDEIRQENPNTSFPDVWTAQLIDNLGMDQVLDSPQPTITRYQIASRDGVEQDAKGNWVWKWVVVDMDDEQKAAIDAQQAQAVRDTRNKRIADSDWTQLDDTPVGNAGKLAWASYRQALRDITAQPGFPWDIQWPTKPE